MPKPQSWQGPKGMRSRKSRVDVARSLQDRPPRNSKVTAVIWLVIGFVGIGFCIAGLTAWPLIIVGAILAVVAFPMAIRHFRKVDG
ncbi:MAG: hypothetical protein AAF743_12800 [Planctomycetota bacterium]